MAKVDQEIAHAIFDITLSIETLQANWQYLTAEHKDLITKQIERLEKIIHSNDPVAGFT